jgi:hypothetical protein
MNPMDDISHVLTYEMSAFLNDGCRYPNTIMYLLPVLITNISYLSSL